jgi:hypothetical protein
LFFEALPRRRWVAGSGQDASPVKRSNGDTRTAADEGSLYAEHLLSSFVDDGNASGLANLDAGRYINHVTKRAPAPISDEEYAGRICSGDALYQAMKANQEEASKILATSPRWKPVPATTSFWAPDADFKDWGWSVQTMGTGMLKLQFFNEENIQRVCKGLGLPDDFSMWKARLPKHDSGWKVGGREGKVCDTPIAYLYIYVDNVDSGLVY